MKNGVCGNSAWQALSDEEPDGLWEKETSDQVLERIGFYSSERVSIVAQRARPLDPKHAQRLSIRFSRRHGYGRRGMPEACVKTMYLDYLRLGSLAKVGKLYGRTRQSVYEVFHRAGLELHSRNFHAAILFNGLRWTPGKGGYYRPTTGDRTLRLHHAMWEAWHLKKVPAGWQVTFADGDNTNFRRANLICLPIGEVTLLHYRRRFPSRSAMSKEQRRDMWRTHSRLLARRKRAEFRSQGKEAA